MPVLLEKHNINYLGGDFWKSLINSGINDLVNCLLIEFGQLYYGD